MHGTGLPEVEAKKSWLGLGGAEEEKTTGQFPAIRKLVHVNLRKKLARDVQAPSTPPSTSSHKRFRADDLV